MAGRLHFSPSNQKAKVTNIYDEEFVVATIPRIRDAIASIYTNSAPLSCQSQHFNAVNSTHSTGSSNNNQITNPYSFLP